MAPRKDNNASLGVGVTVGLGAVVDGELKQSLHEANAKLCRVMRRFPWMYDRRHPGYAKQRLIDKTWIKISKECGDSVASCKERWRNIRAAFARSINVYKTNSGPNRVKPYYLHDELIFLADAMRHGRDAAQRAAVALTEGGRTLPVVDGHKNAVNLPMLETPLLEPLHAADMEFALGVTTDGEQITSPLTFDHDGILQAHIGSIHIKTEDVGSGGACISPIAIATAFSGGAYTKALRPTTLDVGADRDMTVTGATLSAINVNNNTMPYVGNSDADAKFLEMLLPDMRAMNARQKIIFKRKIYQSLEEVFDTSSDFPPIGAYTKVTTAATPTTPTLGTTIATTVTTTSTTTTAMNSIASTHEVFEAVSRSIASLRDHELVALQGFINAVQQERDAMSNNGTLHSSSNNSSSHHHDNTITVIPRSDAHMAALPAVCVKTERTDDIADIFH